MCSTDPNDPAFYLHGVPNPVNQDIEDIWRRFQEPLKIDIQYMNFIISKFVSEGSEINWKNINKYSIDANRVFKVAPYSKIALLNVVNSFRPSHEHYQVLSKIKPFLVKKEQKSTSGILSVTLFTGPDFADKDGKTVKFSCEYDCYFCPSEPNQPKSYLQSEPGVLRANQNGFDCFLQFNDRVSTLQMMGHSPDKLEVLVLGGTFHSYPEFYREEFIRDIFYSANTYGVSKTSEMRPRLSLALEKILNETASCKIIGLTLETRPDQITKTIVKELRYLGCTRVQLGLQHTNNAVLKKINRGHSVECAIRAIKLLKDSCFKIDIHLMQNLPGSSPDMDMEMTMRILHSEELQADQFKLYPCTTVPWTVIEKWYKDGTYVPYSFAQLLEVLIDFKTQVHPWIRLNRVVRDIPSQYIIDNSSSPDMRNDIKVEMDKRGLKCACIRCREIGGKIVGEYKLVQREYIGSGAREFFISYETSDNQIIGFCRLRLPTNHGAFQELDGFALVRELHVYGQLKPTDYANPTISSKTQHFGFGTRLMREAERIAFENGYRDIAVIAGVGVRGYYRKIGYVYNNADSEMMVKNLDVLDTDHEDNVSLHMFANQNKLGLIVAFVIGLNLIRSLIFGHFWN